MSDFLKELEISVQNVFFTSMGENEKFASSGQGRGTYFSRGR